MPILTFSNFSTSSDPTKFLRVFQIPLYYNPSLCKVSDFLEWVHWPFWSLTGLDHDMLHTSTFYMHNFLLWLDGLSVTFTPGSTRHSSPKIFHQITLMWGWSSFNHPMQQRCREPEQFYLTYLMHNVTSTFMKTKRVNKFSYIYIFKVL